MTNPRKQLQAIAALAQALDVAWPTYEATEAALGQATMRSGSGAGTSGGDHGDPVVSQVLSHQRYMGNSGQLGDVLELLRDVERSVSGVCRHRPEVAREVDAARIAARCSGEIDPTCVKNAVKDGLCSPCWQRRYRAEVRADQPMEVS